jgi:anti-sigma factor RsiW
MDCREFHEHHSALLDQTLPPLQLVRAHRHLLECEKCAAQDAAVRRALLVFRNMSPIEPSRDFSRRLNQRLAEARALGPASESRLAARIPVFTSAGLMAGLVLMVAVASNMGDDNSPLTMAPVLASRPESATSQLVTPTMAASMSIGFPVWPAMMMMEQASQQIADAEFHFASLNPR